MIFNLECTSSNPKDHSCEVSLQSDKNNIFSTFMLIMAMVAILKYLSLMHNYTSLKHSYEVSLQSDQNVFFYLSWLSWQSSRVTVNIIIIIITIMIIIL